jgi:hypothetical protein
LRGLEAGYLLTGSGVPAEINMALPKIACFCKAFINRQLQERKLSRDLYAPNPP